MNTQGRKTIFACLFVLFQLSSLQSSSQTITVTRNNLSQIQQSAFTGYFPTQALVLLADGTEKRIEEIKPGDMVATYDPVLEDYVVSPVTHIQVNEAQLANMWSVMLILEEFSASIQASGGLAGVSVYSAGDTHVLTSTGSKRIEELTDNDFLYCYDDATRRFHIFRVYDIKRNDAPLQKAYRLSVQNKNCIINSTVILQE